MAAWPRRGAWGLVLLVLLPWLVAGVLSAAGVTPGRTTAGSGTAAPLTAGEVSDPHVVLVGIPGLSWEVVDEATTPTLAGLAAAGGAGALVLRGTHEVTCAADAWLTVGAGQRASADVEGCRDGEVDAAAVDEVVQDGAVDPQVWDRWRDAAGRRALAGELGTLAALAEQGGTCVAAYGTEAVLGAASPDGRAEVAPEAGTEAGGGAVPLPSFGATTEGPGCRIHLVSADPVTDRGTAAHVDQGLAALVADAPAGTTVVVAGLGHTADRAEAMAVLAHPVGRALAGQPLDQGGGAALSSGSTQQRGLVQLTDLTPTLLQLAGVTPPTAGPGPLAGQPLTAYPDDGHVATVRDLAAGTSLAKSAAPWVLGSVAAVVLPLLVLAALLRRWHVATGLVTVAMAVPVATFLAGLVPWWRAGSPVPVLTLVVASFAVLVTGAALAGPWRRDPLAPPAVVAALTLAVLGVDMLSSAPLGLVSVLGLQPVTAGRFYGQGNVGFGMALGSFVVLAAAVLSWLGGSGRSGRSVGSGRTGSGRGRSVEAAVAVLLLGASFMVVAAAPWGGADFGGVAAVVVATGLLVMAALGLRWRVGSLLALGLLGVVAAGAVMVLDWRRGPGRRTHLGDFVQRVLDGEALGIVTRKLDQSLGILLSYPLSWLAVLALVLVAAVVVRRPTWSAPLWRHPGVHPAAVAGLVAVALAWVLNDSGIAVVALALTVMIAAALHVLGQDLSRGVGRDSTV